MIDLLPERETAEIDISALFGRIAPLHVDLGCGDGRLLQTLAAEYSDHNFLGVERLLHRVRSSHRKAASLPNIRIIRSETLFVVQHLLPPDSVQAFYLLFPDPWPKRRHHRRRLVTAEFLEAIWSRLIPNGSLFIATDHDDYFATIRKVLQGNARFSANDRAWILPATTFERKFVEASVPIHRLELRKVSAVT